MKNCGFSLAYKILALIFLVIAVIAPSASAISPAPIFTRYAFRGEMTCYGGQNCFSVSGSGSLPGPGLASGSYTLLEDSTPGNRFKCEFSSSATGLGGGQLWLGGTVTSLVGPLAAGVGDSCSIAITEGTTPTTGIMGCVTENVCFPTTFWEAILPNSGCDTCLFEGPVLIQSVV